MTEGPMTISQAAEALGLSRQLIHAWVKKGKFNAVRTMTKRGVWLIPRYEVQKLLGSPELAYSLRRRGLLLGKPKRKPDAYATDMQPVAG